ncbi:PAS domain-containing sensor histidine kinase [Bremerella cremea]|uniref:histidine kinase n=1 Tax=Bremerella cremea TaxID=1031537 RepID=A0A368KPK4_9BACT|nr:ATP-binding protein [Bremerella cremea]RCS46465.1 PAS domain-containing sensor histidine kinase [Bremerella cremea]
MFRTQPARAGNGFRLPIAGLLLLSLAALVITLWTVPDFWREQDIVEELTLKLPRDSTATAKELAVELGWQFRLSILVVINLIGTGLTLILLSRAYSSSQESLRDLKALAGDILSSMDQAVITTDCKGYVTSINRQGMELLGVKPDCVDKHVKTLSTAIALDRFLTDWQADDSVLLTRDFHSSTNGRTVRATCQTLNNFEGEKIGQVLQLLDVTERVLIEERMRRMERYMGLGSLAAGLHHEIRNPLAAVSLHVQLLEEQLEESQVSEEVQQMLAVIKAEMTRIGGVLESFRDFASMDKLNLEPINLARLIQRQVDLAIPQARQQGIVVRCVLPQPPLPKITADLVRMEQALLNLFVNAMQAMPNGGELIVTASTTPEFVRVEISDTGNGIPEKLRERVFDAYFTTKSEGTGLGLSLCDKIVRQHNGNLDFLSSKEGTTFVITLPTEQVSSLSD